MDRLGWSQSKISRIEGHQTALNVGDLNDAALAYGRSTFELLNVNPHMEREVVDISHMFKSGSPDQQKQIAEYVGFILRKAN